jgi:copper chaperone
MNQTFHVSAMTCGHCEKAVTRALLQVDAMARVTIARAINRVDVQSDAPREVLAKAISDAGYTVADLA